MKYYTVIIQTAADGTTEQSISAYDTRDAAEAAFHKELAYALDAKTLAADTVVVMDQQGVVYFTKYWKNSTAESTDSTEV